ncbi:hypothetical protein DFH09DRAFT_1505185 [Mycena vulgaris]|nr:hypothetical protein DFH09DRAFT_1505185 [Mycena vulgaris]
MTAVHPVSCCTASLPRHLPPPTQRQGHHLPPPAGSASTVVSSRVRVSSPSPRGAPSPCPQSSHASPVDGGRSSTPIKVREQGPNTVSSFRFPRNMCLLPPMPNPLPLPPAPSPRQRGSHSYPRSPRAMVPTRRAPSAPARSCRTRTILCATGALTEARRECMSQKADLTSVSYTQRGSEFRWYSVLLAIFDIQDYFALRPTRILTLHLLAVLLVHDFYDATGLLTAFSATIPPYPVFKVGCIAFPLAGRIRAVDPKLGVSSEPPDSPVALGAAASKVLWFPGAMRVTLPPYVPKRQPFALRSRGVSM